MNILLTYKAGSSVQDDQEDRLFGKNDQNIWSRGMSKANV